MISDRKIYSDLVKWLQRDVGQQALLFSMVLDINNVTGLRGFHFRTTSTFGVVFFVSKSRLGIERQKKLKITILTRKP